MGHGEHHQPVTDLLIDEAIGKTAGAYRAEGVGRGAAELGVGSEDSEEPKVLARRAGGTEPSFR
jgi:hypothetical protein